MGALNRFGAFQAVNDTSINAETVKQILGLAAGEGEATPPGDGRAAAAKSGGGDEFGEFLADVAVTVGKAVEAWRARVGGGGLRGEGEGDCTQPLQALLPSQA